MLDVYESSDSGSRYREEREISDVRVGAKVEEELNGRVSTYFFMGHVDKPA